jgi:hypothetical protein
MKLDSPPARVMLVVCLAVACLVMKLKNLQWVLDSSSLRLNSSEQPQMNLQKLFGTIIIGRRPITGQ